MKRANQIMYITGCIVSFTATIILEYYYPFTGYGFSTAAGFGYSWYKLLRSTL